MEVFSELAGIAVIFLATILLAIPLGKYMSKVYGGEKSWSDFIAPIEKFIFRISGIDPLKGMNWKEHLKAMLTINSVWFVYGFFMLLTQSWHFWNPDHNPSMKPDLAFNTVISFLVNCNLQHYSGETGMSYLSQLAVVTFFQFTSAATGMSMAVVVFNAMRYKSAEKLGNFYMYFVKSITRILLPLSIILAVILTFRGVPVTFKGQKQIVTVQGETVKVARGPVAPLVAIKQLGTNGCGFFGANSAHPFENPDYFTNMLETSAIFLIPVAMVFALGFYLQKKKIAWLIFGVMTTGFLLLLAPAVNQEMKGNPAITSLGINQPLGNMEGKEVRFGSAASAFWGIITTSTSSGSVNSMHDSFTPLTGMSALLGMMINSLYGGVGVGFLNYYIFIIITVFIAGLMVGRTPEFLGRKIEAREIKIAVIVALIHPLLILTGTAISAYVIHLRPTLEWLGNPGFHGFSEMLYEFSSASANNGSTFAGIADNNMWFNLSTGVVLAFSRYIPIIGPVAIAGILAKKKVIPDSAGTLQTDSTTFGVMTFVVIIIIAALSFFPALALGPLAEHFSL